MEIFVLIYLPNWLLVLLLIFVTWYIYATWTYGAFHGSGLPGPDPRVLVGTLGLTFKMGFHAADVELQRIYGKTFAMFEGRTPVLYTTDEDIIRAVTIKQFQLFVNRRSFESNEPSRSMLNSLRDDEWRRVRNLLSPTFSTGKIRKMTQHINHCTSLLAKNLQQHADDGTSFEVKKYCGGYTMDAIAATAFGLQLDSQKDLDNPFVKMAKKAFDVTLFSPAFFIMFFFPFLTPLLLKFNVNLFAKDVTDFFAEVVQKAVDERKKSTQKDVDFLQLMMNAHEDESTDNDVTDPAINDGNKDWKNAKKGLSHGELLSQGIVFFVAGYETTARALSYLLYNLAVHPDVQEKVHREILEHVTDQENVDSTILTNMPYLDHCVNETLRLYPPTPRTDRQCQSDVTIKGLRIKKGWVVSFPIFGMHRNPEYWDEPEEFRPERFANKTEHNYHFMPFGAGPRNCIGMRLALMEIKMAAIQLLRKYTLVKTEETLFPMRFHMKKAMEPEIPLKIGVQHRS